MMINPWDIKDCENKTYEELLAIRNDLFLKVMAFETYGADFGRTFDDDPTEITYVYNLDYLSQLCKLISDKFGEMQRNRVRGSKT